MKFDFDKLTDRSQTNSMKWEVREGELPMWVADMDFETAPVVKRAILKRAEHGCFGYSLVPDSFFEAVSSWWQRRHGVKFDTSSMIFTTGVVPAISSLVRRLSSVGDNVLIQAPVYNIFYNSILNNGRVVLSSDLVYDEKSGEYDIDFADLEEKMSDPKTTLMILCNPHNPVGKIWSAERLCKIGELAKKHSVSVISDEIHCDIVMPGRGYVPFASVSEVNADISVTLVSSSKAFNTAGLQCALAIIKNKELYRKAHRGLNTDEVAEPNAFATAALEAAFNEGEQWLDALCEYLFENRRIAEDFIERELPRLKVTKAQATYLLWVNISSYSPSSVQLCDQIREKSGLYISDGYEYGECANGFVRINLATQRDRLYDGLMRLKKALSEI